MSNMNLLIARAGGYQAPDINYQDIEQNRLNMDTQQMRNELARQQLATEPERQKLEQTKMEIQRAGLLVYKQSLDLQSKQRSTFPITLGGQDFEIEADAETAREIGIQAYRDPQSLLGEGFAPYLERGVKITKREAKGPVAGTPEAILWEETKEKIKQKYAPAESSLVKGETFTNESGERIQPWFNKYTGAMIKQDNLGKVKPDKPKEGKPVANQLRDEFTKGSQPFVTVRDSYNRIMASAKNPSPAGDLSMLFNYMKMLDPGSTVREGEFAQAAKTGSFGEQIKGYVNRLISGERLTAKQRDDFLTRSSVLFKQQKASYNQLKSEYSRLAKSHDVEPSDVIVEYNTVTENQENDPYEVGSIYEDAKGNRKKYAGNGQWEEVQ